MGNKRRKKNKKKNRKKAEPVEVTPLTEIIEDWGPDRDVVAPSGPPHYVWTQSTSCLVTTGGHSALPYAFVYPGYAPANEITCVYTIQSVFAAPHGRPATA